MKETLGSTHMIYNSTQETLFIFRNKLVDDVSTEDSADVKRNGVAEEISYSDIKNAWPETVE